MEEYRGSNALFDF